jgi:hypothetical protein
MKTKKLLALLLSLVMLVGLLPVTAAADGEKPVITADLVKKYETVPLKDHCR